MTHLNLDVIKGAFENDLDKIKFGERLRFDQVKWLIKQAEKAESVEMILNRVTATHQEKISLIRNVFKTIDNEGWVENE